MRQSFKLGSFRGIGVRMHITFPLILIWAALQFGVLSGGGWGGAIFGIIAILILFFIVVLHEFGHGLVAQRYGVEVKQIVLLPIGGVAQLAHIPEKPSEEFAIAVAGPAVNFALALVLAIIGFAAGLNLFGEGRFPAVMLDIQNIGLAALFLYIFTSNLMLGLFNLIPAFPMDGGRVLRALLATRLPYSRATLTAVKVGQVLAIAMGIWGFIQFDFFWILIALFIYAGAGQERRLALYKSVLGNLTVGQAYSRNAQHLSPDDKLRDAVELTLNSFQSDFPVCEGDKIVGLLSHTSLVRALNKFGPEKPVHEVMQGEVPTVSPNDNLAEVQQLISGGRLDALPVVDGDTFLGLITLRDLTEIYQLASARPDLAYEEGKTGESSVSAETVQVPGNS